MKQTRLLILFVCIASFANSYAANRYWVGGAAATWDASTTTCWSETSGGTSGASVPVAGDDVIFDNSTNANSTSNASPTVTLGVATPALNSITFTSSNVTFVGAKTITTNNMTIDNSQVAFVSVVTINSALTFSSTSGTTTTPRFSHSSAAGSAITLGNGGAFTLTGNSATNYFTGTSNSSFRYNTTSALTVFFKTGITISGIYVYKGLITLGNNLALPRLNFPPANLNNQELIVAPNITLTLSGGASSGYTELAGGGTINASASGSKVLITQTAPSAGNYNSLNTAGRIFKANTTINNLEVNTTGNMVLGFPITVRTLTKTAGTITTTSTNKITIAAGGNVVEGAATISGTAVELGVVTTRYWVGGASGNWFNEANWGTSSGNTDTDRIPEYGDNVVFDNSTGNENPTVTLTDHVTAADINFSGSNVTFAGADSIKTNSMSVNSSQVQFVDHVKVNSSLTFSGTNPRITQLSTTSGRAFICGNGGAFTLTGNSTNNYFTGNTNAYYTFNTSDPLTVYFNPTTTTAGALVVTKGLITLGNNINTNRLTLSATNSQELILSENVTLNITGGGTSTFTDLTNGGVINASATGSKVLITSTAPTFLNAGGTKRIFKDAKTINHLEMNSNGQTFVPAYPLTVKNLTLTAGAINNTNNITIPSGGNLVVGAGTTTAALAASLPSVPTIGIATAGNAQAAVAFTAPANGGSLITGYTVTPYDGATAGTPVTQNANPIVVTGLNNGTAYTFTVIANNGVGASDASDASTAVTPISPNVSVLIDETKTPTELALTPASIVTVDNGGTLNIDATTTVNSVTVGNSGKIIVAAGKPLTVGTLTLTGALDGTTTSIKLDDKINASTVRLFKTIDKSKWFFMSFPYNVVVANITKSNGSPKPSLDGDAGELFIKYYDGEQRGLSGVGSNWKHYIGAELIANQGYIIGLNNTNVENEITLSFPLKITGGVLPAETSDRNISVAENPSTQGNDGGWNLIGQPFLSKFIANHAVGSYDIYAYNGVDYSQFTKNNIPDISPFSAYFIQASAALAGSGISFVSATGRQLSPSVAVNELMDEVQLDFTSSTGSDYALLRMDNSLTTGYDIGSDFEKWIGTGTAKPQIYTSLGGINYAFNALPMNNVVNLPLGIYTQTAGTTTIHAAAAKAPSLSKLLLTDKSTSPATVTDLLMSDYTFTANAGTDNARFVITAQRVPTNVVETDIDALQLSIVNGKLLVNNMNGKASVRIFDAIGRMIANKAVNNSLFEITLPLVGMYTVQIEADGKNWTRKILNQK
jgi:hypothetical protein